MSNRRELSYLIQRFFSMATSVGVNATQKNIYPNSMSCQRIHDRFFSWWSKAGERWESKKNESKCVEKRNNLDEMMWLWCAKWLTNSWLLSFSTSLVYLSQTFQRVKSTICFFFTFTIWYWWFERRSDNCQQIRLMQSHALENWKRRQQ